jgi:hypothetical protein
MNSQLPNLDDLIAVANTKTVISMAITMYLRNPMYPYREGVIYCLEQFLEQAEPHLAWYADAENGRFRKAKPALLRYPIKRLNDAERTEVGFSWIMYGGEEHDHASPWEFHGSTPSYDTRWSFIRATFPVQSFLADPLSFVRLVKGWADRLPVVHGYGGFALNESVVDGKRQRNSRYVFAVAQRFPGLEVEDTLGTAMKCIDWIKGVNWLTLLGEDFVQQLGGVDQLRSKLGPDIHLYPIASGGQIIQAGDRPGVGDVNAGERLPAYRDVARILKPIRAITHPALGFSEFGSFGETGTEKWLRRFDD